MIASLVSTKPIFALSAVETKGKRCLKVTIQCLPQQTINRMGCTITINFCNREEIQVTLLSMQAVTAL